MALIDRVQSILLRPRQTWPVIAAESADVASIYTGYLCILAAVPAIAGFVGRSIVGFGMFGVSSRLPIVTGVVQMFATYVLTLVIFYVVSLVVDALAPTFGGSKSPIQALKLVAYSTTAVLVASVLMIIPSTLLSLAIFLGLIYSIYLFYLGVPTLMRCPAEKAGAYTAVVVVCWLVVGLVLGSILSFFVPMGFGGRLAAMEGAGKALGGRVAAMTGSSATPIAPADLKAMLPEAIGDLKRTSLSTA